LTLISLGSASHTPMVSKPNHSLLTF